MYNWARLGAVSRPWNRAFYRTLRLFFAIPVCHAILVNQTIDSNKGDSVTGLMPIYQPQSPSGTWADQTCAGCYIQPDTAKAFDGTWNAATYNPGLKNVNITLHFTGVAVWVFFILSNANSHGPGTTTNTHVNITLDGQHAGTFSHEPDLNRQDLMYNALIFSTSGLANTPHELVIATNDYPLNTFINFDWAAYSVDLPEADTSAPPSPSTSSSTPSTTAIGSTTNSFSTSSTSSPTLTNSTSSTTLDANASASQNPPLSTIAVTNLPSTVSTSSSPTPASQSSSSKIGIIVGSTLGGLAVIALVLLFLVRRLRRAPPVRYTSVDGMLDIDVPPRPQPSINPQTTLPVHTPTQSKEARLREARQMEIGERIHSIQPGTDNLNPLQTARSGSAGAIDGQSAAGPLLPAPELASLRNEVQQLRDQIGHIQAQRETNPALDLFNEPLPPAYT